MSSIEKREFFQQCRAESVHIEEECTNLYDQISDLHDEYVKKQQHVAALEQEVKQLRAHQDDAVVVQMNGRPTLIVDKSNSHLYQFSLSMNFILVGALVILWLSVSRGAGRITYE